MNINENTEDTSAQRGHSRSELDLLLTPESKNPEDIIAALSDRNNYGEYLINTRNKKEVENAIIKHFGPNLPTLKKPLEKKQGFPFPPKTRQSMEDLIKSFEGKPNLLTYEPYGENQLLFPTDKNNSQVTTSNILKTVLGNAGIKYKLDKFENLKEYSKPINEIKRLQKLAGI